ncbi:MAG: DUF2779 domain-containing protein [Leptospirales bacterium]
MPKNTEKPNNFADSGSRYQKISTSLFLKSAQCSLWGFMEKYNSELKETRKIDSISIEPSRAKLFALARLLPLFDTENQSNVQVDFNVKFASEDFRSFFDIVRKSKNRTECYTLKTSSRILPAHFLASSYAWYVAQRADFKIDSIHILYVNKKYTLGESFEPESMLSVRNVTTRIQEMQDMVSLLADPLPEILKQNKAPHIEIGPHCYYPYPCYFQNHCWKNIPDDSVFNIAGMDKQKQFELFSKGIVSLNDIDLDTEAGLNEAQQFQVQTFQNNRPFIDKKEIQKIIDNLVFPVYFLDFEAFCPPVPIFENTNPFQFIPFQYSLHSLPRPDGEVDHSYFLAAPEGDPRKELLKQLCNDLGASGTVLIYGDELERATLNELKHFLPEYNDQIENILERLVDFSKPFRKRDYYHPAMNGSYSIKKITPGLFKNISYKNLPVRHGGEAARVYESIRFMKDREEIVFWENALKEYCKTDTFVMVELYRILKQSIV